MNVVTFVNLMDRFEEDKFQEEDFPESYKSNNSAEIKLLSIVDNFCKQYYSLYKDRKTLFITPKNEFGVEVGFGDEMECCGLNKCCNSVNQ